MSRPDTLYDFCRSLRGVTEDVKWEHNLVFSVGEKMFAAFHIPDGEPLSFKANPDAFQVLTRQEGIEPAPYLARAQWVWLERRDVLPIDAIKDLLEEAHSLVASKLSKRLRRELGIVVE